MDKRQRYRLTKREKKKRQEKKKKEKKKNQCHVIGVKKSYFGTKKSFLVGGGVGWWVKSDFSVSLCPFS